MKRCISTGSEEGMEITDGSILMWVSASGGQGIGRGRENGRVIVRLEVIYNVVYERLHNSVRRHGIPRLVARQYRETVASMPVCSSSAL